MANMHLVTGHAGKEHVRASDHGSMFAALFGTGQYILDKGNKFAASIISDNLVRILDGDLLMQGRHARIPDNEYVELVVESGTQGYKRSDLIVARYTKNADTGVEEINLVVLLGEPVAADPKDPAYVTGDLLTANALENDVVLYRLNLDGTTLTGIDSLLPDVLPPYDVMSTEMKDAIAHMGIKYASGSYTGTDTAGASNPNSLTFSFPPKLVFIRRDLVDGERTDGGLFLAYALTSSYTSLGWYHIGYLEPGDGYAKVDGNTLSWYHDSDNRPDEQLNLAESTYHYFAIG